MCRHCDRMYPKRPVDRAVVTQLASAVMDFAEKAHMIYPIKMGMPSPPERTLLQKYLKDNTMKLTVCQIINGDKVLEKEYAAARRRWLTAMREIHPMNTKTGRREPYVKRS